MKSYYLEFSNVKVYLSSCYDNKHWTNGKFSAMVFEQCFKKCITQVTKTSS